MDNSKLTGLPEAIQPISGDALVYMVQDGNSVQAAVADLPSSGSNWTGDPLAVVDGGTEADNATDARANLGAASQADLDVVEGDIVDLQDQITSISVAGVPAFATTAAGISGTSNGDYFQIIGALGSDTATTFWLNSSGVAVQQSSVPSTGFVNAVRDMPINILAALGGDLAGMYTSDEGSTTPNAATFPGLGNNAPVHPVPFTVDGMLSRVSIRVETAGPAQILTRDPLTETVTWIVNVNLAAGRNDLYAGVSFPPRYVSAGEQLLYYAIGADANMRTTNTGAASTYYASLSAPPTLGSTIVSGALVPWTQDFAFEYENVSAQNPASPAPPIRSRITVLSEHFPGTSTPSGWSLAGGFTVNDGLMGSTAGGWANNATKQAYTAASQQIFSTRFLINTASTIVALAAMPNPAGAAPLGAGAFVVDNVANKLGIYAWYGTATAPTKITDVTIPALVVGDPYILTVTVNNVTVTGTMTNVASGTVTTISTPFYAPNGDCAAFKGGWTAINVQGSSEFEWAQIDQGFNKNIKGLYIGDSNMAGTLASFIGLTWPMYLSGLRPEQDLMISANGGDSNQWLTRLPYDFTPFSGLEQAVFALGTNYSSQSTWRTDMTTMINTVRAAGVEALICTQIPISGKQSLANAMNADILGGYFGNIRIVDIAAAVTTGGDRINWAPRMDHGDGVHMSLFGQQAAYLWAKENNPYLWQDAPDYFLSLA